MPDFIQAHDHPVPAAVLCEQPAHWIAPFVGFPTWADVEALFGRLRRETPTGQPLLFNGLDRLLLSIPMPDRTSLDRYFPDHPVLIFDITGHALYFNSRATQVFGWTGAHATGRHSRCTVDPSPGRHRRRRWIRNPGDDDGPRRLPARGGVSGHLIAGRRVDLEQFMASVSEVAHRHGDALLAGSRPHRC